MKQVRRTERTDSTRLAPVPLMRRLSSVSLVRAAFSPSNSRPWAFPESKMRRILSAFLFRAAFSPSNSRPVTFPNSKMRRRLKKKQVGAAGTLFSGPQQTCLSAAGPPLPIPRFRRRSAASPAHGQSLQLLLPQSLPQNRRPAGLYDGHRS